MPGLFGLFPQNNTSLPGMLESNRQYAEMLTGQRYNDVLEQRLAGRDRLLNQLEGYGAGETARINQDYTNTLNSSLARLQNRGFAASNLDPVMSAGIERSRQQDIGQLNDRVTGMRTGLEQELEEGINQFQERRTDSGPTAADAAALGAQLGGSARSGGSMRMPVGGGGFGIGMGDPRLQETWLQNQNALLGREQQLLAGRGGSGLPTGVLGDRVRSRTPMGGSRHASIRGGGYSGTTYQAPMTEQQQRDALRAERGIMNTDTGGTVDPNSLLFQVSEDWIRSGGGIGDPKGHALGELLLRNSLQGIRGAGPGFTASVPLTNTQNLMMRKGDPSIGGGFGQEMGRSPKMKDVMQLQGMIDLQNQLLGSR